ncbi:GNAT family N-acetyltransferase [Microbacterium kyungheense]|uniref:RimJ/RimL family protein N-acetyltransferase n=1 Tax=Microbacterium kyungheense TaxID=1263636 RepID=A0A543F3E9_9MICO|nr:GNAT family protein [Microbacterium kyungheense]TQM28357.1 RimJ/RimL family protein N-acetyltransferase [Microbacterium kyungheense]
MPHPDALARLWPASAVRARAGDLELRWIDDQLLLELAELAGRGIHAPDAMPFEHPWTRGTADEVARSVLTYQWGLRGEVSPQAFALEFAVLHRGVPVGIQGLTAKDWTVLRTVTTGSWLGLEHQGHGIGTRMRALILHLAFEGFGALEATSGAFADNGPSNAVSRRLGYESDGAFQVAREGAAVLHNRYTMSRERWLAQRDDHAALLGSPVELWGVEVIRTPLATEH